MKVICLYGRASSGKTSTLNILIKQLEKGGAKIISQEKQYLEDQRVSLKFNEKTVTITTGGDYAETIKENFEFALSQKCDLWITATRTSGNTVKEIENIHIPTDWIKKSIIECEWENKTSNFDYAISVANQFDAERLFNKLKPN